MAQYYKPELPRRKITINGSNKYNKRHEYCMGGYTSASERIPGPIPLNAKDVAFGQTIL